MNSREFLLNARSTRGSGDLAVFKSLPWLLSTTLDEFASFVKTSTQESSWTPHAVQEEAYDFHIRAGTLSPEIERRIERIQPRKLVRLSHQPNFFAYLKLVGQFVALEELATAADLVPVYYFIDYDTINDLRFGRAEVPDPSNPKGSRLFKFPSSSFKQRTAISRNVERPPLEWLERTMSSLSDVANIYSRARMVNGSVEPRISRLTADLELGWHNARNIADMSAIILSRFINLWLGIDIPFISGSKMWSTIAPHALNLDLDAVDEIVVALGEAKDELRKYGVAINIDTTKVTPIFWWLICPCNSRVRVELTENRLIVGICDHCGTRINEEIDKDWIKSNVDRTAPKILLHNLLNMSGFGYVSGVSHIGSAEHVLLHSLAIVGMGRKPMPQWLWECSGNFGSLLETGGLTEDYSDLARRNVQSGNASFAYLALCEPSQTLRESVMRMLRRKA